MWKHVAGKDCLESNQQLFLLDDKSREYAIRDLTIDELRLSAK